MPCYFLCNLANADIKHILISFRSDNMNEVIAQSYQVDFVSLNKENTFLNTVAIEEGVQEGGGVEEKERERKREPS